MMSCWLPETLYDYSPKKNRESILENGLLGGRYHDGRWCIYLSDSPDTWKGYVEDGDLWKVSIGQLDDKDFGRLDDEITYWGKVDGKIRILPEYLERIE
jgi:hypothetical protein